MIKLGTRLGANNFSFIQQQTFCLVPKQRSGHKECTKIRRQYSLLGNSCTVKLPRLRRMPRNLDKLGIKKVVRNSMHRLT